MQWLDLFDNYDFSMEPHELLQPTNIRHGYSPAEREIDKELYEDMRGKLEDVRRIDKSQKLEFTQKKALKGKLSVIEKLVVQTGSEELVEYLRQSNWLHR